MAGTLGSTPGIIVGVGVGSAAAAAIEPALEIPKQQAWKRNANRILNPQLLARLVAEGAVSLGDAQAESKLDGYDADKLNALVYLAQTVPGWAQSMALWRRHPDAFGALWTHSLVKQGLDSRYLPYLNELFTERLSPPDIAYAIVRGLMHDAGLLPVAPPSAGVKIKRFPVSPLDPLDEARAHGFDRERLRVLVGRSGLSMAPGMAAQALFRGIIELDDFYLAIAEGDLRNEWRDAIRDTSRQILTSHDAAELELRGYLTRAQRLTKTDAHGMVHGESDLLYDLLGRSIPVHQVTTGLARGGSFEGPADTIPRSYLQSLQRGNLRPEYYNLAYANRYSYSVPFWWRSLVSAGVWNRAQGEKILLELGNPPAVAAQVARFYAATAGDVVADPHVTKAQNQLWTALHGSYVKHKTPDALARTTLTTIGVDAAARPRVLELWQAERDLVRAQLTVKQIKEATDPPYATRGAKLAALQAEGYSLADATTILDE